MDELFLPLPWLAGVLVGCIVAAALRSSPGRALLVGTFVALAAGHAAAITAGLVGSLALDEAGIMLALASGAIACVSSIASKRFASFMPHDESWLRSLSGLRGTIGLLAVALGASASSWWLAERSLAKVQYMCGLGGRTAPWYEPGTSEAYHSLLPVGVVILLLVAMPRARVDDATRWRPWLVLNTAAQAVAAGVLYLAWSLAKERLGADVIACYK